MTINVAIKTAAADFPQALVDLRSFRYSARYEAQPLHFIRNSCEHSLTKNLPNAFSPIHYGLYGLYVHPPTPNRLNQHCWQNSGDLNFQPSPAQYFDRYN
jgi:hypothetical protein